MSRIKTGDVLGDNNHIGDYVDRKTFYINQNSELSEFEQELVGYITDLVDSPKDKELLLKSLKELHEGEVEKFETQHAGAWARFITKMKDIGEKAMVKSVSEYLNEASSDVLQKVRDSLSF